MTTSPTDRRITHGLSLTDGTNTLALMLANRSGQPDLKGWQRANNPKTSLRVVSGNEGYGDFELPFSSIVQSDWSGGRAARDFEKDTTKYADGYRCDSNRGNEFRCGPAATQGSGYNISGTGGTGTTETEFSTPYSFGYAGSFTPASTLAVRGINLTFWAKDVPASPVTVSVGIWSNKVAGNEPDVLQALSRTIVYAEPSSTDGPYVVLKVVVSIDLNMTLTAGTKYWLGLWSSGPGWATITSGFYRGASTGNKIMKYNGLATAWEDVYTDFTFAFTYQTQGYGRSIIFDYRSRKMAVTQSDDQTAPKLWMQGYHGMATSNAADKSKLNTALNLSGIDLAGKYARIIAGPGSTEETPWRKIVSNTTVGTNDVITVAPSWNITHTTATEFVIQGCSSWQEITDSGGGAGTATTVKNKTSLLTTPVTDVLVVDDIIYFCQGESVAVARTRIASGVWSDFAADGTNMMTFMELVQDEKGAKKIWGAKKAASSIAEAPKLAWGTSLTFTTALVCGDTSSQITGLLAAKVTGPMLPIVFKETEFGAVSGSGGDKIYDTFYVFPEARDDFNGRSAVQPDVYLWFSLMDGIERYYDQRLDDVGPNRDEGLPKTRKGRVSAMVKYFSQIFVAYDAGRYGYSSILRYNGLGWCEVYRGSYGRRIRSLNVDVLPELDNADRLWFSEEEDIYYIPIALDPDKVDNYTYFSGAQIETAWIFGPYRDITKYWDTLAIFGRNLTANIYVSVEYKVDSDANAWTALPDVFNSSPVEEHDIATLRNVTGKSIKFRLTLTTNDTSITPVVTAVRVNAVIRVKPKAVWNVTCVVSDGKMADLQNVLFDGDVNAAVDQLEAWQDGTAYPSPLTASFFHTINDQKRGFVDSVSTAPIEAKRRTNLGTELLTLISFQFIEV